MRGSTCTQHAETRLDNQRDMSLNKKLFHQLDSQHTPFVYGDKVIMHYNTSRINRPKEQMYGAYYLHYAYKGYSYHPKTCTITRVSFYYKQYERISKTNLAQNCA